MDLSVCSFEFRRAWQTIDDAYLGDSTEDGEPMDSDELMRLGDRLAAGLSNKVEALLMRSLVEGMVLVRRHLGLVLVTEKLQGAMSEEQLAAFTQQEGITLH